MFVSMFDDLSDFINWYKFVCGVFAEILVVGRKINSKHVLFM